MDLQHYFDRTSWLVAQQSEDLIERIRSAANVAYTLRGSSYAPVSIPEDFDLRALGSGRSHTVIGLNYSIFDPSENREVPLAIRFHSHRPYRVDSRLHKKGLIKELSGFIEAAERSSEDHMPYVVAVATAEAKYLQREIIRVAGILVEDLTNRGNNEIREQPGDNWVTVVLPSGEERQAFMDPRDPFPNNFAKKYLEDSMRIDC